MVLMLFGVRHCKLAAAAAMLICSLLLLLQPFYLAKEMASPLNLLKNTVSIKLAELLQLEPCFFQDDEPESCSSEAED